MLKINLVGTTFGSPLYGCAFNPPKYVKMVNDGSPDIFIYLNDYIFGSLNKNKRRFALLMESPSIIGPLTNRVRNEISYIENNFEALFTADRRLLSLSKKFKFTVPIGNSWIQRRALYDKTKLVSFIASDKKYCPEHILRHEILEKYKGYVDHYGRGFVGKELPWVTEDGVSGKILGLKDYMFSFVIENTDVDLFYTEKISDCFATGTVPIYWGPKGVVEIFDKNGIIFLEDFKLDMLNRDFYESKMESIKKNLEICKNMLTCEDYIYMNYIKGGSIKYI